MRGRRRPLAVAIAGGAVLAAALLASLRPVSTPGGSVDAARPDATVRARPTVAENAVADARETAARTDEAGNVGEIEALRARFERSSLRGTTPDGEIVLAASGRVTIDAGLRRRFEHYLSLLGEFEPDEIARLLHADALAELGYDAAQQVEALFARYLGLRRALAEAELATDLSQRLGQVQALRREWFGDEASRLFGDEADYDRYALERRAIARDGALTPAERDEALAQLDATRPPAERAARAQTDAATLAREQSQQFDRLELDAQARHDERTALWGSDAADRLARLDQQRADWDLRLQSYARERERLMADPRVDPEGRRLALAAWRERRFDPNERRRVEALESVGALPPPG